MLIIRRLMEGSTSQNLEINENFARELKQGQYGLQTVRVKAMSPEAAAEVAERVMGMPGRWKLQHFSYGTPQFWMGNFYGHGWANKTVYQALRWTSPDPLWDEFAETFESMRAAISSRMGQPTRLHKGFWPPVFQMHLPHFIMEMNTLVHTDSLAVDSYFWRFRVREVFQDAFGEYGRDYTCEAERQYTVSLSLSAPHKSGVRVWYYNDTQCPDGAPPAVSCVGSQYWQHMPGHMLMFPSQARHLLTYPFSFKATAAEMRVIVVAFAFPCTVNGKLEWQMIGSFAR